MKNLNRIRISLILLLNILIISLLSCEKEGADLVKMRINHFTQDCTGVAPQQCLLVQQGDQIGTDDWSLFYSTIEGFSYESDFVYDLLVKVRKVENPPADASSLAYKLVEIIVKEPK